MQFGLVISVILHAPRRRDGGEHREEDERRHESPQHLFHEGPPQSWKIRLLRKRLWTTTGILSYLRGMRNGLAPEQLEGTVSTTFPQGFGFGAISSFTSPVK